MMNKDNFDYKKETIVVFAPSYLRSKFFYRVVRDTRMQDIYNVIFFTSKRSAYLFLKAKGMNVININQSLHKSSKIKEDFFSYKKEFQQEALQMDLMIGIKSDDNLIMLYNILMDNIYLLLQELQMITKIKKMFIFNGNAQFVEYSAKLVASYFNIEKLFFEIGNFPKKIFIDKDGVNSCSSLMRLDFERDISKTECDLKKFSIFKNNYLNFKEQNHIVPQSKNRYPFYLKIIDYDNFEPSVYFLIKNLLKKIFYNKKIVFDTFNIKTESYIFFPLQVSYDSQVIRNSSVGLVDAIDKAYNIAKQNNCILVIKPHPAQKNNTRLIKEIRKKYKSIKIVNTNTYKLLKYAKIVITINSTVGLESFFYHKKLVVLGDAFYKKFVDLSNVEKDIFMCYYLNEKLIDGDYFDESVQISKKVLKYI